MLGRLRIQPKQAIPIYEKLLQDVFTDTNITNLSGSDAFKASKLEAELKKIVRDATGDENARMVDTQLDAEGCKTCVSR
jgi:hypothetical protein